MKILSIDPGPVQSAWLVYDPSDGECIEFGLFENDSLALWISDCNCEEVQADILAIEMIACYGMAVGEEVFETCVWIGRFIEAWEHRGQGAEQYKPWYRVFRKEVKLHLCNSMRANDSNIRQALIDRYGPGREKAIGTKKTPGPLYGIKKDLWSALAIAVTFADTRREA